MECRARQYVLVAYTRLALGILHGPGPSQLAERKKRLTCPRSDDYSGFNVINTRLLNTSRELKHVPLRLYIPQSPTDGATTTAQQQQQQQPAGAFKVVQSLVPVRAPTSSRESLEPLFPPTLSQTPVVVED